MSSIKQEQRYRIGIVINTSWNIYNFRRGIVERFLNEGWEVYAIAPKDEFSKKLIELGCQYIEMEMDNKGSNPFSDFNLMMRLKKAYKKSKLDMVLHYTIKPNIYGTLAANWVGIPCLNNVSGLGTVFLHNNLTSKIAFLLYSWAFRYPKTVFFQNEDDRSLFIEKKLVKENIIDVLPGSGVNLDKFCASPAREEKPFRFLMVSRLLYDKGVLEFIEACRALRDEINAEFVLLGATDFDSDLGIPEVLLNQWLEEKIIEYIPFTEDVSKYYASSHCVVLPSYREGTPRTLLEGAACGRALVSTDVAGCKEVVKHSYNGFLCEAKNAESLKKAMKNIYSIFEQDFEAFADLSSYSRKIAEEKFDENIVIDRYYNRIVELLDGNH